LAQLANQEEKTAAINSKIKSAFTYPIVVLVVLLAVFVMMIVLVLPQVANMYKDLKTPLPPLTQALLAIANTFKKFYYLFFLAFAGIAYGVRAFILTPRGKYLTDTAKIRVPVVKVLVMKLYMSRFSRTLGSLVASGVPVLQALNITSRSMNNVRMETAVNEVTEQVKSGVAMSVPISDNPMFLTLVGQMIGVGEQTGTLGDSLNKVASYYEDEVDEAVKNISTLIEPATMVVLGGLVAFLIAAVLLPIYGLVSSIK
jgi:type IV pilus assembly protein PilC